MVLAIGPVQLLWDKIWAVGRRKGDAPAALANRTPQLVIVGFIDHDHVRRLKKMPVALFLSE